MKRIICSALLMSVLTASADTVPGMTVKTASGTQEISLANIASIKFSDGNMIIAGKDNSTQTFAVDDVTSISFGDITSAIQTLYADSKGEQPYTVADTTGRIIARGMTDANGKVSNLKGAKGIYIITVGKNSRKVAIQ